MRYIENIILNCLKHLNGERTIYSIYHLLNGKKSSQTLQDAHLFSLKNYFRILESLTRESFDEIFARLIEKNWVKPCGEQKFLLTTKGEEQLQKQSQILPGYINGWKYQQYTVLFWERLSLLIQVASNLSFQETQYIPIQKNKEVHNWLKEYLKELVISKMQLGRHLFQELVDCLGSAKEINPAILVFRFTGYQQIGLTEIQTAKKLKIDPIDYQLEFINILHFIIQMVENDSIRFKLLSPLLSNLGQDDDLTLSARKTLVLLNQGHSIERIAVIRNLKLSTIEDHLVEFALNIKGFSIDDYVDRELQRKIIEISSQTESKQLKIIRNNLDMVSYFQIRLVLAKYGDRTWN